VGGIFNFTSVDINRNVTINSYNVTIQNLNDSYYNSQHEFNSSQNYVENQPEGSYNVTFFNSDFITKSYLVDMTTQYSYSENVSFLLNEFNDGSGTKEVIFTTFNSSAGAVDIPINLGTISISPVGDGTSSFYAWGAQLEAGSFSTSYIPTVASQVTRNADAASMTGANFSSGFNNAEGTIYAAYQLGSQASSRSIYQINDGTSVGNQIGMRYTISGNSQFVVFVNNINQVNFVVSDINTNGSSYKIANAYTRNNFNQSVDGLLPSADDTSGILPTVDRLRIGCEGGVSTAAFLCGTIAKLAYYPYRLSNAQLQALTGS
jgi:hypothetical protein